MRRSGKSFRLFQEIQSLVNDGVSHENILYFNFEDERLKPYPSDLGDRVLAAFYEVSPDAKQSGAYLFLDEIQEMPDWGLWLCRIVDTEKATIYATGSSSKVLSADIATEFRGRSVTSEILPFGFSEYLRYHDATLADKETLTSTDRIRIKKHFDSYMIRGGFPAIQDERTLKRCHFLQKGTELKWT